jgi:putative DNA primase/helicase
MDFIESFKKQMALDGIVTQQEIIIDGELHRVHVDGDSIGSLNGWYVLYSDNVPGGAYGCWKRNINKTWCSKSKDHMTSSEWSAHLIRIKAAQAKQAQEKHAAQAKASENAKIILSKAKSADNNHPYLIKKNIRSHGLRLDSENRLIIPLFGADKKLYSLQFISPEGDKRFLSGGLISGNYFPIGNVKNPTGKIYIGEGYATCMTLYQVTGCAVACAFNCGNLFNVAKMMKEKHPEAEIIIVADDDFYTLGNPGIAKAKQAAASLDIKFIYPDFTNCDVTSKPTDFNDLMCIAGIDEVKKQLKCFAKINDDWPEPETIQNELLPVESLPIELIPEPLLDFVADEANRMQCPIDFIAISILEVISAIVGAGCGIKPKKEDDWLVIPNLWGCIIGRPGKLKTPAASSAIIFLDKLEADEKSIFDQEMRKYEIERESFKAEKDAIKREISASHSKKLKNENPSNLTVEDLKNKYSRLQEPNQPKRKRFKSNDATVEKLSELLAENPRGLLLYRDELMGLLTTWDKTGHESDRAFFLEAWNGKGTHTTDRIGRGTIDTGNMCVSVFGTSQPDKLIRYLSGAMQGNNDGLLQRFQLLIYPDDVKWELVDKQPNQQARTRVLGIIKSLASMDFSKYGAAISHDDGRGFFRFDAAAQALFYEWLIELEKDKLVADDHHLLLEHLSKYRKLMPALALLFHLIDLADGKKSSGVSISNAARACGWCEYLEAHARRIYALVTDIDVLAASILAKKIIDEKLKNGFTLRDVYRQKGFLKDREIAKSACAELIELGWLREVKTPPAQGQKIKISYQVNPKIKGGHYE